MSASNNQLNLAQRIQSPTPSFFKKLRLAGLILAAISGALVAGPVAVPAIVSTIAGYLAVAGGVMTAVSQTAVETVFPESVKEGKSNE